MRLRTRFLLVLASFSVIMILAAEILARIMLTRAATQTDSEEARMAAARGESVLKEEVDELSRTVADWATWDDTCEFMASRNPHYLAANVVASTFDCLRMHAIAFYDTGGQVVASADVVGDSLRTNEIPVELGRLLERPDGLLERANQGLLAGFAVAGEEVWMLAVAPIVNSKGEGPSRGKLVMGRRIDDRQRKRLARLIDPSFRLAPAAQDWPPGKVDVDVFNPGTLQTRVAIKDVFGSGRLVMEVDYPRTDYLQIPITLAYLSLWIIALGAGVWLLGVWLLNRWVLRSVTESVEALRNGLDLRRFAGGDRSPLKKLRNDEIGELIDAVGAAIDAVETSAREADKRRAEAIHSQRLAALGTMAAGVAHEINNPNGVVNLNLNVLRRELGRLFAVLKTERPEAAQDVAAAGDLGRVERELSDTITEALLASERIAAIIASLRSFARPADRAGKESVLLPDLIEESAQWLRHDYKRAQCRLEIVIDQDLPRVTVNRQHMVQVFVNLMQNACQAATRPDSVVRVSGCYAREEGTVAIGVADEGRGMPPEDVAQALDPFFTTRRNEGGMGLGLSISAAIVKAHGGTLRIESREGAGTVVTVTLPVREDDGHGE